MVRTWGNPWKTRRGKIIFLLVGVGLLVGGGFYFGHQQRFAAKAVHADGVIVRLTTSHSSSRKGGSSTAYCPVVRFVTRRAETIEFESNECWSPAPRVGASIKVLYDPDNPYHAKLDTLPARLFRWGLGVAMTVLGLLFVAPGIAGLVRRARAPGPAGRGAIRAGRGHPPGSA